MIDRRGFFGVLAGGLASLYLGRRPPEPRYTGRVVGLTSYPLTEPEVRFVWGGGDPHHVSQTADGWNHYTARWAPAIIDGKLYSHDPDCNSMHVVTLGDNLTMLAIEEIKL